MTHKEIETLINNEADIQIENSGGSKEVYRAWFYNGGMFAFRTLSAENEQEIARLREALEDEKEDVKKYILLALERKRENDKLRDLLQTWVNLESDPHRMPEVSKVFNDSIQALEQ